MKQCIYLLLVAVFFTACSNGDVKNGGKDTAQKTLRISVDESFESVMREQVKVFEVAYPDVTVMAEYKPEADCLRDLEKDSTKIIIISRELTRAETAVFGDRIGYKPQFEQLAKDAVAVIVNNASPDSTFTMQDLKETLSGNGPSKWNVAIDGNTATSTVRFLRDSLLRGAPFGKNITGAKGSEDLVNFVSTTRNALGFIGISWLTNPQNVQQEKALQNVRMAMVECKNCDKGVYAKPSQQTITFDQYPLVRGLYYVLKENYAGMGSRFVQFLTTERGQLIFKRALLVPKMNFYRRSTNIQESE